MRKRGDYVGHHAFQIGQHICIGEAQNGIALGTAIGIAAGVVSGSVVVGGAVEFYDELGFAAEEIREIGADGHLAAEFVAMELAVAEMLPEEAFWWGGFVAEGLGASCVSVFERLRWPTPQPPPACGRGSRWCPLLACRRGNWLVFRHAAAVRLRKTSSRSGSLVTTSTIERPLAWTALSTCPALARSFI